MHFFRTLDTLREHEHYWFGNLTEAHHRAKCMFPTADRRCDARIELIDVDTSKTGLLRWLQEGTPQPVDASQPVLRNWTLSPRGGLMELDPGD